MELVPPPSHMDADGQGKEELNSEPPQIASLVSGTSSSVTTPTPRDETGRPPRPGSISGYILFAAEVRKTVVDQHPDNSFGEVSRMIGMHVRNYANATNGLYQSVIL